MANHPDFLYTPRLVLRPNDPDSEEDCRTLISIYNNEEAGRGGNARVGLNTKEDVRVKHVQHGPTQKYCTRSAPPKGLYHLVFLRDGEAKDEVGEVIGWISMSFRDTIPWPDIGYGFFPRFWGKGYGPEAGREALKWWQEVIGVEEVWYVMQGYSCWGSMTGAMANNIRSQRCAEKIGFVRCGEFDLCFGLPGEETWTSEPAYVLPGMDWTKAYREDGGKPYIRATLSTKDE